MNDEQLAPEKPTATEMTLDEALTYALQLQQEGRVEGAAQLYARILEQAPHNIDALHFLGIARFQLGDGRAAVELIQRAIALSPNVAGVHNNLGNVLLRLDRLEEAAQAYQRVIELDPQNADAHSNLGALLRTNGQTVEAEALLRRALALNPDHAEALHNFGNLLSELTRFAEAADMYARAMQLRPYEGKNYLLLGMTLYSLRREDEALAVFRRWLEIEPDSCEAQHLLAAATQENVPKRAADAYVQRTFDRFASSFDEILEKLEYRAPQLLRDTIEKILGAEYGALDILDAGCGTGLCGPLLKRWARQLTGVDLSPKMIEQARLRNLYDQLIGSELTAYLSANLETYDLVVSSDTLCYFGDLTAVIKAAAASLRPKGWLGFTVEKAGKSETPDGYSIQFHGRYRHTESYIRWVLDDACLQLLSIEEAVLRMERQEPVHGLVVIATKAAIWGR